MGMFNKVITCMGSFAVAVRTLVARILGISRLGRGFNGLSRGRALLKALGEVRAGQRRLSGRVISVWAYQRREVDQLDGK